MKNNLYAPDRVITGTDRVLGWRDLFSLWFSLGIGLAVLQAGAVLSPGLGMVNSIYAVTLGSLLGCVLLALAGVIGFDTGRSSMASMAFSLGQTGASVPAVLNLLQLVGWGAFEIVMMRDAAALLAARALGSQSFWANGTLWTWLFGIGATAIALGGPLAFIRLVLRRFGIYLLLIACAWLSFSLWRHGNITRLAATEGNGSLPFAAGCDIVISMALSWLPLIGDYTRFGKSARQSFLGTLGGYLLGSLWMMVLGGAYALAYAGNGDANALLVALSGAAMGIPLLLILIDENENAFADIHSAALSSALFIPRQVQPLTLIIGLICTLIAWQVPLSQYENFLLLIGSVFSPLFGVVLAEHFLIRRRRDLVPGAGLSWRAFVAWAVGIAVYQLLVRDYPQVGATLPSLLVAGLLHLVLGRRQEFNSAR
ncbi:putative hydroxymethylpyrimidine transporter CytX [Acerihabitans sp. KWT182]|uniref:Hydroxymethylpyrimidine transporter CytX n=1 Tax=Acerihabitans sp. KWT182 TaxID=3157919 RepID=A0AAU7QB32_9GAMM